MKISPGTWRRMWNITVREITRRSTCWMTNLWKATKCMVIPVRHLSTHYYLCKVDVDFATSK